MNTTKAQRDEMARLLEEINSSEPVLLKRAALGLIFDEMAREILPNLLADAERAEELQQVGYAMSYEHRAHVTQLVARAEAAEAERDTLRRLLDVAVGALRTISEHDGSIAFMRKHSREALAQIEKNK